MKNKAVLFDRDDTLIVNVPYNGDPEKVKLLPDAKNVCHTLVRAGYRLILVTNQSAVGRGLISREQVTQVNKQMERQLELSFDGIYCCFDDPNNPVHGCRKPSPVMIEQAARDHCLDLASSVFIGDKESDIQAGHRAGCRTCLLVHPHSPPSSGLANYASPSLYEICLWILKNGF
jgi:D-glycero-D-manno-heptose 1,7-bisphosphate phosphatase